MNIRILNIISSFDIRISNLLSYLIILFLPTQLGRHFWPEFSYVLGVRVDYLSPTLYLTDILIMLLFCFWLFSKFSILSPRGEAGNFQFSLNVLKIKNLNFISNFKFQIIFFLLFLTLNIAFSKSPMAGLYGFLKFFELGFFGFYVAKTIKNEGQLRNIVSLFSFGILFESLLAIVQFLNQGSIGHLFYFFGERTFSGQTPGIANASLSGVLVLRPYGTFPHPNVLAGYLTIAMTMVIFNFLASRRSGQFLIFNQISNFKKFLYSSPLIFGSLALMLTMSRVAILLWLLTVILFISRIKNSFQISNYKFQIISMVVLVCIGSIFILSPLRFRFSDIGFTSESVVARQKLIEASLAMVQAHPLFGVGVNNFLSSLPFFEKPSSQALFSYLQPVHNIFLLIAAETGMGGLLVFVWFLGKTYNRITSFSLFIILSTILVLGMFDHYFLTLQQGQFLLALVLGLCWSNYKS